MRCPPPRRPWLAAALSLAVCAPAYAASPGPLDLTQTWIGLVAVAVFVLAYAFVISEEFLHVRKSKPVIVAAGLIWILVAVVYAQHGDRQTAGVALRHNLVEYAELLLFLLAAMTYINTLEERNVFRALQSWLVSRDFTLRGIFWLTGILSFFISAVADNLTTALLMAAVVMAVGAGNTRFVALACINLVVAANAGGAFSPFGDITTLMVWQKGIVKFEQFFYLFLPSFANWLVPAALMSLAVPTVRPAPVTEKYAIKPGGLVVIALFVLTIALTVSVHHFLHLPPVLGMMTGLGLLNVYGFFLRRGEIARGIAGEWPQHALEPHWDSEQLKQLFKPRVRPFDVFISIKRAEWDTLLFFYGVVLCVGGLGALGYLALLSQAVYTGLGASWANILVGVASAVIDNIPIMYAVLSMQPDMSLGQWLLVTLTAGVGGSLLSIGSAAGVALMGQARGVYTFFTHLRWSWAIALGYAASIWVHFLVNAGLM